MHPYSIDTNERTNVTIFLFLISLAVCYLLNSILVKYNISIPMYVESPTPFVVFGILYGIFDSHLWKIRFIRLILMINTPNLNGNWEGEYESSYKPKGNQNQVVKGKVRMSIQQSWTKIRIESNNQKSNSYSVLAGIVVNSNKGTELKFEYENASDKNMVNTMNLHTGFTTLKHNEKGNELEGTYYTDKNRRTYGNLKYVRV